MSDEDSNSGGSHDCGVEYDDSVPLISETPSGEARSRLSARSGEGRCRFRRYSGRFRGIHA